MGASASSSSSAGQGQLSDNAAYDKERLRLDQQARSSMKVQAAVEGALEIEAPGSQAGAWKWAIRKKMWDYMEVGFLRMHAYMHWQRQRAVRSAIADLANRTDHLFTVWYLLPADVGAWC